MEVRNSRAGIDDSLYFHIERRDFNRKALALRPVRCYSRKVATGTEQSLGEREQAVQKIRMQRTQAVFTVVQKESDTGLQMRVIDDTLEKLLKSSGASQVAL
jgi:hypothetical protein